MATKCNKFREKALERSNAIAVLAGYVPTPFDMMLDRGLVNGSLTTEMAIEIINTRARCHGPVKQGEI